MGEGTTIDHWDSGWFNPRWPLQKSIAVGSHQPNQTFQVPNMEESSPMFQPYGYGLCREIPTPENSLKRGQPNTSTWGLCLCCTALAARKWPPWVRLSQWHRWGSVTTCDISLLVGLMWMQIRNTCSGYLWWLCIGYVTFVSMFACYLQLAHVWFMWCCFCFGWITQRVFKYTWRIITVSK